MMKKNYQQPATTVVSVAAHGHILQNSVRSLSSNSAGIIYGGAGNANNGGASARVKDAGEVYDVWNDDWSE